ncbi:DUF1254 domain-containing protein [Bradyrhizobium sp. CCBAU 53415]|uniref:DUF1254 domain-containing protein n=1 Tax=Bradyrhizobium sp. CCBAU 53415 TaxID=1325119 RepID=UPI002306BCB7|nr:DUF1254 domain-containing protein [Bradyrhizobium sp. CCBAU 53415]MDA9468895.1 cell envelope protein [Bradyrhizobium sp. CCBAU 53415]
MLTRRQLLHAAALASLPTVGSTRALAQTQRYGFIATRAIARDGFIYGLPIVMSYAVMYEHAVDRRSGKFKAPFNQIKNESRVFSYKDAAVVLPNNDTLCSLVWMDLRAEPIVLSVPAIDPKRYYSIMLRDHNFYNCGYIGSRSTGNDAGDYMVVGPDWSGKIPSGICKVFRSSTQFAMALYRTQLFDPGDVENVRKVQAGYRAEPLSKQAPPPPAQIAHFQKIRKKLLRRNFFQHLAFALQFAPAQFIELEAHANLAKLGVGPGRTFDFGDLSLKRKLEITLGIRAGARKIDRAIADANVVVNGWRVAAYFGDSAFYNGNWLLRAAAAKADFFGTEPVEAVSLFAQVDEDAKTLDGSENKYTLTFAPDQMPPVNAFWSLTIYDGKTRLLVRNPINRYLVNSSMLPTMTTDEHGLTIYIQNKPPDADRKANWLPAPNGPLLLAMRLYWPKAELPSILPIGKGTWQPPGLKRIL